MTNEQPESPKQLEKKAKELELQLARLLAVRESSETPEKKRLRRLYYRFPTDDLVILVLLFAWLLYSVQVAPYFSFISGDWTGWYEEQGVRGSMLINLKFDDNVISGAGLDPLGSYTWLGTYDENTGWIALRKSYATHVVIYTGYMSGNVVQGTWRIPDYDDGPFELWPKNAKRDATPDVRHLIPPELAEESFWPTIFFICFIGVTFLYRLGYYFYSRVRVVTNRDENITSLDREIESVTEELASVRRELRRGTEPGSPFRRMLMDAEREYHNSSREE